MRGVLLDVLFEGDKGVVFSVVLFGLLVAGAILLVVNLSARPRPPQPPAWEPVPDDTPASPPPRPFAPATPNAPARAVSKPAPRRKA